MGRTAHPAGRFGMRVARKAFRCRASNPDLQTLAPLGKPTVTSHRVVKLEAVVVGFAVALG